ncbi:MAG: single-stranded-DNA-specific exonuclease RecJ, partial [Clostridiales bacterium]|nr:single-stranded-DNA-specific exonuclease RecJ [Clostridiales bacterium]
MLSTEVVGDPAKLLDILFENRGIKDDTEREAFTSEDGAWYDPFLFNDMRKAVDLICHAIDTHKKILIYGDYDCDGVTATAILVRYFKSLGCDVSYIVPQREEHGYGLTDNIIG